MNKKSQSNAKVQFQIGRSLSSESLNSIAELAQVDNSNADLNPTMSHNLPTDYNGSSGKSNETSPTEPYHSENHNQKTAHYLR